MFFFYNIDYSSLTFGLAVSCSGFYQSLRYHLSHISPNNKGILYISFFGQYSILEEFRRLHDKYKPHLDGKLERTTAPVDILATPWCRCSKQTKQLRTFNDFSALESSFIIGSLSVATNTLFALAFFTIFFVFLRISLFGGKHISWVSFLLEPGWMHCGDAKKEVVCGSLTCSQALSWKERLSHEQCYRRLAQKGTENRKTI